MKRIILAATILTGCANLTPAENADIVTGAQIAADAVFCVMGQPELCAPVGMAAQEAQNYLAEQAAKKATAQGVALGPITITATPVPAASSK